MSLARIPELRRISILTILGTVALLVLAAAFPRLTYALAILAILVYSVPYIFFVHIFPRKQHQRLSRDIWVREMTPEMAKEWYAAGRITEEEYERMMRGLEEHQ